MTTEPIADVVRIAVDHRDFDAAVDNICKIWQKVGINKVAGLLESPIDVVI